MRHYLMLTGLIVVTASGSGCAARVAHTLIDTGYHVAKFAAETAATAPLKMAQIGAKGVADAVAEAGK